MMDEGLGYLLQGNPETVKRRFELLRRENDARNAEHADRDCSHAGDAMSGLTAALRDFISLFDRLDVQYVLMGGFAVRVYGIPRPTYDVDFTVAVARERLPELYRAIAELGYWCPSPTSRAGSIRSRACPW